MNEEVNPKLPSWNGDWGAFESFELRVGLEIDSTKEEDLVMLGPRLAKNLTSKAFEWVETLDRSKLKKKDGAQYLVTYLKEQRGKDRVDIMGDALRDFFKKPEVKRREGEEFSEFLPRFRHYSKAVDVALKEVNPEKKMPEEFYGWYLLNESMGLDATDVANIKAKAESYSLRAIENAIRTMWSGGGLAQRDAEKKKMKSLGKAFVTCEKGEGSSIYGVGEQEGDQTEEESEDEDKEALESVCAAFLEDPQNEGLLVAYQEAKKKVQYKEARKMLTKSRVNRDFYPMSGKGSRDRREGEKGKGKDSTEFFNGDCIRCGKYGHKARNCPQRKKGPSSSTNYAETAEDHSGLVGMVRPMTMEAAAVYATMSDGHALRGIIDSGASETIIGVETLQDMWEAYDKMGFDPRQEIRINRTLKKIFVYGNNETGQAIGLAHLNIGLLGREVQIEAHVVDGPTPLLLSAKFLLEHRVSVDFSSGKAWFPDGGDKPLQLERSPNYHLLLPVTGFAGNKDVIKALQIEDDDDDDKFGRQSSTSERVPDATQQLDS